MTETKIIYCQDCHARNRIEMENIENKNKGRCPECDSSNTQIEEIENN